MHSFLLVLALCGSACVAVKPYQRAHHASPAMTAAFDEEGFAGTYRAKVTETQTGGGLPGGAPGGGCGCTN